MTVTREDRARAAVITFDDVVNTPRVARWIELGTWPDDIPFRMQTCADLIAAAVAESRAAGMRAGFDLARTLANLQVQRRAERTEWDIDWRAAEAALEKELVK